MRVQTVTLVLGLGFVLLRGAMAQVTLPLDPIFGEGGLAVTDLGGDFEGGTPLLRLPDGRYILAGGTNRPFVEGRGGFDLAILAFTPDGRPDPTFGTEGIVVLDLGGSNAYNEWARALVLTPDDHIVVVGEAANITNGNDGEVLVARYDLSGRLDPGFGEGGIVLLDVLPGRDRGWAALVTPDGSLLVGVENWGDFAAVRLQRDGEVDTSFGNGGVARMDVGGDEIAQGFALDSAGRLLASGTTWPAGDIVVARWSQDGQPDPSFGTAGMKVIDIDGGEDQATMIRIGQGGEITLFGFTGIRNSGVYEQYAAIVRLTPEGNLNLDFGDQGIRVLRDLGHAAVFSDVAVDTDGRFLTSVNRLFSDGTTSGYFVRFLPDGAVDSTYGSAGMAALPFPLYSFLLERSGQAVASVDVSRPDFAVGRFAHVITVSAEAHVAPSAPETFRLLPVYPNPTAGEANVRIVAGHSQRVQVAVFDVLGRQVGSVFDGSITRSGVEIRADISNLPSGTYVMVAKGEQAIASQILTIVRD